jgi:hypothetical protein
VSMSSSSDGTRATRALTPAASASARWRSQLSGPTAGGDGVGRAQQEAVGAAAVAVGHDHDAGLPARAQLAVLAQQLVQLRGVERGAVAGYAQNPLDAFGERAPHAQRRRRRLAVLMIVLDHDRAALVRGRGDRALRGDDDRALDRLCLREREQHVENHRASEL